MRHLQRGRLAWGLAASFILSGCSIFGGDPESTTTPTPEVSAAVPSAPATSADPSASATSAVPTPSESPSTPQPRNDLKAGRLTRTLTSGSVVTRVNYSLRNPIEKWSLGVPQPLTVSLTVFGKRGNKVAQTKRKIYLSRVTVYLDVSDANGHLYSPEPLVDKPDITPGFLVTFPTSYTQVFVLPPLQEEADSLSLDIRYELLSLQSSSIPRDFSKRTATDTIVISKP